MPASPLFSGWNCVLDGGEERRAVVAPREGGLTERPRDLERPVLGGVGVHEVEPFVLQAAKKSRAFAHPHRVPAHVREHRRVEFGDRAGPLAEPLGVVTAFHTVLEHHLHADTDAQHRQTSGETTFDDLVAARGAQGLHHGPEGSDAGYDQTCGVVDQATIGREPRIGSRGDEGLHRGVDIARPVVEHSHERPLLDAGTGLEPCGGVGHRAPFVLGMPWTRGSSAFACRKARANALYSASAMWCGSRPPSTVTCIVRPALKASASNV